MRDDEVSNTRRAIPGWIRFNRNDESFIKALERGHIDIPKSTGRGDEIWGQIGKKNRKKILTRKHRRNTTIEDQLK